MLPENVVHDPSLPSASQICCDAECCSFNDAIGCGPPMRETHDAARVHHAKTPRAPPTARYSHPAPWRRSGQSREALNPNHRRASAHILMVCRLTPRCAALRPCYHSRPHVRGIGRRTCVLDDKINHFGGFLGCRAASRTMVEPRWEARKGDHGYCVQASQGARWSTEVCSTMGP